MPEGGAEAGMPVPPPVYPGIDTSVSPPPAAPDYTTLAGYGDKGKKAFHEKEVLLMQQVARHGEKVMYMQEADDGTATPVTVAEHIASDLALDGLQLQHPLHRRMLEELLPRVHEEGFTARRYFFSHPDPQVARLAADLSSDRYQLSKYHSRSQKIVTDEERLLELVPHLLTDLKLAIIEEELKGVLSALQDRAVMADAARYMEIMKRYKDLSEVQRAIAKRAGERVVLS